MNELNTLSISSLIFIFTSAFCSYYYYKTKKAISLRVERIFNEAKQRKLIHGNKF